ncbi:MAG TPA: hypothetical protein PKK00_12000 [Bacteroidales bacterium]|nr:hypothetical protein [Bacteroidales bacterium]HPS17955.1 hypothetical protein [Bacteroidales bacterium]
MKKLILIILLATFSNLIFAGSPIISVSFYKSYSEISIVNSALSTGKINDTIANYLLNDTNSIDSKAAVINALSMRTKKSNASLLMQYIMKKYNFKSGFDLKILTTDDVFCLGYLTITDNTEQTEKAIKILNIAAEKDPKSFTIQIILALVEAELYANTKLCEVYKVCSEVNDNKELTRDMKQSAIENIFTYMDYYKSNCHDKK